MISKVPSTAASGGTWTSQLLRVLFAALLLLPFNAGFAQLITADLVGAVTDQAGAVVANAKVTVVNTATGETRTDQTS